MNIEEHRKYYNSDNKEIPSVTTILKIVSKPALITWANILGFKRQKYQDVLNHKAIKGTIVHHLIDDYLKNKQLSLAPHLSSYRLLVLEAMDKFITWYKDSDIEVLESEMVLRNESFGGTTDLYCKKDNKFTLLDFKTSKDIYITHVLQLAGYVILLEEMGKEVNQVGIVTIPENKKIKERYFTREELEPFIIAFKKCLEFYISYNEAEKIFNEK